MKAFEEWRNKNYISGRSYKADERVWRAALEWVKTQSRCCRECLMEDIDEELDDSNTRPNGTTDIF